MKPRLNLALMLAAFVVGLATTGVSHATGNQSNGNTDIRIDLNDGLLSAEIHDVPLPEVLEEIGKLAGFKVVQVAGFSDFPRINSKFEKQTVQVAVERLLVDTNRILFYVQNEGGDPKRLLSQLWLLGPGKGGAKIAQSIELIDELQHEEPVMRSTAALRLVQQTDGRPVLENLALMLQTDPDPLVRSRVAIALGALGDDRAASNLEMALLDENFTVRVQSMTALGRIGGSRSTVALGEILLDDTVDPVERVVAAQALWKQDSEIARGYLDAGSSNSNAQVRAASREAPPIPAASADGVRYGPDAFE